MTCKAIEQRKHLTEQIQAACSPTDDAFDVLPADGTEKALLVSFAVLHGIVNEYLDGGDQLTEECDCGEHQ